MALLEGAEAAKATATGMAAVNAAMFGQLSAGDHVVACKALFGSCRYIIETLLPRFGVQSTLVDGADLAQWEAAVRPNTKVFFLESPTNPTLEIYDIAAICRIAKKAGIKVTVDNVFATPMMQSPLQLGADCVVYSTTKHIDGQGRCLGGVILGSKQFIQDHIYQYLRQTGPAMSPFNAWVVLKSLETLPVRVERQAQSAAKVADALAELPGVTKVIYPGRKDHPQYDIAQRQMRGGSTLIAFEVEGGKAGAFRVANALNIIRISNNLGDAKSLITHPPTTTHDRFTPAEKAEMGITDGLLRLSVGLEDADDLIDDLSQALKTLEWPVDAKIVRL
jgi:O-succinylhomoserine sulfhydrylase